MSEFTVKPINAYFIALIIGFIVTLSVSIWKKTTMMLRIGGSQHM